MLWSNQTNIFLFIETLIMLVTKDFGCLLGPGSGLKLVEVDSQKVFRSLWVKLWQGFHVFRRTWSWKDFIFECEHYLLFGRLSPFWFWRQNFILIYTNNYSGIAKNVILLLIFISFLKHLQNSLWVYILSFSYSSPISFKIILERTLFLDNFTTWLH